MAERKMGSEPARTPGSPASWPAPPSPGTSGSPASRPAPPSPQYESILQRKLTLSEMLDLPSFTTVCAGFADLYRVGLKVYEEGGQKLVDIKGCSGEFCAYLFEFPAGRGLCMKTAARAKDGPLESKGIAEGPPGTFSVPCFTGCRYLVVPIRHEGEAIGRAIFGPFVPDDLRDLPANLAATVGGGFDLGRARELLAKMRRAPESAVARVIGHFAAIVDALVFAGQKVLLTGQVHIEATREAFREIEAKNRELTQSNARLRELDRLKSNFLATVSHELRTPLTSIIGYSEMLVQGMAGSLQGEQEEYVRTILEKGESLLGLISSILDVNQIEAGRLRLTFAPTDLNDLVHQAVTSVLPQLQKKKLHLDLQPAPPSMAHPSLDREKVRQCVVNLLANALKFTEANGTIRVSVLPQAPAGVLREEIEAYAVVVEDTGIGIPEVEFDRIFTTFYQVDQSSTRQHGGAGIGLTIVKSFVEAHGGRVKVESEVGRFSRFTLALPYQPRTPNVEIDSPF